MALSIAEFLVQSGTTVPPFTLSSAPAHGDVLVCFTYSGNAGVPVGASGWTSLNAGSGNAPFLDWNILVKTCGSSESTSQTPTTGVSGHGGTTVAYLWWITGGFPTVTFHSAGQFPAPSAPQFTFVTTAAGSILLSGIVANGPSNPTLNAAFAVDSTSVAGQMGHITGVAAGSVTYRHNNNGANTIGYGLALSPQSVASDVLSAALTVKAHKSFALGGSLSVALSPKVILGATLRAAKQVAMSIPAHLTVAGGVPYALSAQLHVNAKKAVLATANLRVANQVADTLAAALTVVIGGAVTLDAQLSVAAQAALSAGGSLSVVGQSISMSVGAGLVVLAGAEGSVGGSLRVTRVLVGKWVDRIYDAIPLQRITYGSMILRGRTDIDP